MLNLKILSFLLTMFCCVSSYSQHVDTIFLEELTWTEVKYALENGVRTIIIPTAGTEQNGPHMALGKHNFRMKSGAERIARELGNTLVAPIIAYVPEGSIDPPSGHMRYPGTISIPPEVFAAVLEHSIRSLRKHGFEEVLLIGDSGPNQAPMDSIASKLDEEWKNEKIRVHWVSDWYTVGTENAKEYLRSIGASDEEIGTHAGLLDTSSLLATAPEAVRAQLMQKGKGEDVDGVTGDPTKATAELGQVIMGLRVDAAVKQIRSY